MSLQAAALYATVSISGANQGVRDLQHVGSQVTKTQTVMSGFTKNAGQIAGGVATVGKGMIRVAEYGAAALAGLGVAAFHVASNFQDAFKGIQKTVEGTPTQLNALNDSLKLLSTRIPVKYTDLAGIAQEAGALGVKSADVDKFTEAVARTVAATVGLDTAAASEAFGKIGTIFGLKGKQYEQLGSALVDLGNNAASTEADIVGVTLRFAAAGKQAGLSTAQVLGWSSAIASLGPESEAAGSALSRVFNRLTQNVALMNVKSIKGANAKARIDSFAAVTGLSVKDFVALYTKDASGAMTLFLSKLGKLDKYSASRALVDAGIVNVRDINAVLLLAHQTGVLTDSLTTSNQAWTKNTALVEISNKRFSGMKSTLTELWNTVLLGADAFGEQLFPAIERVAAKAKTFTLGHIGDLKKLGQDVGDAIDRIDWNAVENGAKRVADVAAQILDIVKKIPPEVGIAVAAFLGINKVSGGLLGKGTSDIAGGILGMFGTLGGALVRGLGGKLGGVAGGLLGQVGAQPVFVTNWPLGGIGGGLGGGLAGDAAAAAGGGLLAGGAAAVSLLIAAGIASYVATLPFAEKNQALKDQGLSPQQIADAKFNAMDEAGQQNAIKHGYGPNGSSRNNLSTALPPLNQSAFDADRHIGDTMDHVDNSMNALTQIMAGMGHTVAATMRAASDKARGTTLTGAAAVRAGFMTRTGFLAHGDESKVLSTADYFAKQFVRGTHPWYQSAKNAESVLKAMRSAQAHAIAAGDTKTAHKLGQDIATMRKVLSGDLGKIEDKLAAQLRVERAANAIGNALGDAIKNLPSAIQPSDVSLKLDGKKVASGLIKYGPNSFARNG